VGRCSQLSAYGSLPKPGAKNSAGGARATGVTSLLFPSHPGTWHLDFSQVDKVKILCRFGYFLAGVKKSQTQNSRDETKCQLDQDMEKEEASCKKEKVRPTRHVRGTKTPTD